MNRDALTITENVRKAAAKTTRDYFIGPRFLVKKLIFANFWVKKLHKYILQILYTDIVQKLGKWDVGPLFVLNYDFYDMCLLFVQKLTK